MNEKIILREKVLELRSKLTQEEILEKSNRIFNRLINLKEFDKSLWVMCYMDFRSEVATWDFIHICLEQGKRVAVPVICRRSNGEKSMEASEILHPGKECALGNYGILEPKSECMRKIDPIQLDFIVVPGVAFDLNRQRIGYGAGFYDRFLSRTENFCVKAGVAFELQVLEEIPSENHDIKLDLVITEDRIIT